MVERLRRRGFYKSGDKVDDEIKLARLVDSQKYEVFEKKKNTLFALQLYYPLESSGQEEGTCTLNWIFVLIPRIIIHAAIFKSPAHALLHLLSSNYYYSTHPSTLLCSNIRGHAPKTNTASKKKKITTRSVIHPRTFPQNPATRNCTYYYHHYIYHPSRDLRASLRADALASSVSPSRLVNSTFCARAREVDFTGGCFSFAYARVQCARACDRFDDGGKRKVRAYECGTCEYPARSRWEESVE